MAGSLETCSENPSACREETYLAESETIRTAAIAKKETGERLRMDGAGNKGRKEVGLARWEEDATDPMDGSARVIFQISQCHNRHCSAQRTIRSPPSSSHCGSISSDGVAQIGMVISNHSTVHNACVSFFMSCLVKSNGRYHRWHSHS